MYAIKDSNGRQKEQNEQYQQMRHTYNEMIYELDVFTFQSVSNCNSFKDRYGCLIF